MGESQPLLIFSSVWGNWKKSKSIVGGRMSLFKQQRRHGTISELHLSSLFPEVLKCLATSYSPEIRRHRSMSMCCVCGNVDNEHLHFIHTKWSWMINELAGEFVCFSKVFSCVLFPLVEKKKTSDWFARKVRSSCDRESCDLKTSSSRWGIY